MRQLTSFACLGALVFALSGCGGGGVDEGVPQDAFSKEPTPPVSVAPISPKDMKGSQTAP